MSSKKRLEEVLRSAPANLDVTRLVLTVRDVQLLAQRLETDTTVETLRVDGYRIGDEGAIAVSNLLLINTTISRYITL